MKRVLASLAVVAVVCLTAARALAAERENPAGVVRPCVTLTGADSCVSEPGYYRITSMEDWTKVWQKHKGQKEGETYDLYGNPLGCPLIDFDKYMVIGIFQGSRWNSAGLVAVSITEEESRVIFRFDDKSYQTVGPDGGGKKVAVYGFFVVLRSAKPVVLEENAQRLKGEPPAWKERIVFPKL